MVSPGGKKGRPMATDRQKFFLGMALPWTPATRHLYKCVSLIKPDPKDPKKKITVNHAVQSYDDLIKLVDNRATWRGWNLYAALGTQHVASTQTTNDGLAVKAVRRADNMATFN